MFSFDSEKNSEIVLSEEVNEDLEQVSFLTLKLKKSNDKNAGKFFLKLIEKDTKFFLDGEGNIANENLLVEYDHFNIGVLKVSLEKKRNDGEAVEFFYFAFVRLEGESGVDEILQPIQEVVMFAIKMSVSDITMKPNLESCEVLWFDEKSFFIRVTGIPSY